MRVAIDYRERVERCIAQAEAVAHPLDRARWLQLAEQWALLSRLRFESLEGAHNERAGLWRGDVISHHADAV